MVAATACTPGAPVTTVACGRLILVGTKGNDDSDSKPEATRPVANSDSKSDATPQESKLPFDPHLLMENPVMMQCVGNCLDPLELQA
jgi:hypothetical protein